MVERLGAWWGLVGLFGTVLYIAKSEHWDLMMKHAPGLARTRGVVRTVLLGVLMGPFTAVMGLYLLWTHGEAVRAMYESEEEDDDRPQRARIPKSRKQRACDLLRRRRVSRFAPGDRVQCPDGATGVIDSIYADLYAAEDAFIIPDALKWFSDLEDTPKTPPNGQWYGLLLEDEEGSVLMGEFDLEVVLPGPSLRAIDDELAKGDADE
jgi:hypothetical protein